VWVTSEEDGAVFVIDLATHKVVTSVPVGPRPRSIAFLPDGSKAYVPSENGATVTVVDTKRLKAAQGGQDHQTRRRHATDGHGDVA
jgi:YVTN family beta-propeller protein